MYWLQRPPYLRWAAAVLLVAGAAGWDLRPSPTVLHPFLAVEVSAGDPITGDDLEWKEVPAGLLPAPDPAPAIAAADLHAGEPLVDGMLQGAVALPEGWWAVPVDLAVGSPGDHVLLVVTDPPWTVAGLVLAPQHGDRYSLDYRPATVAVPAESAPVVAAASARGTLVSAVRPAGTIPGGG